jgi:hypothetical protein
MKILIGVLLGLYIGTIYDFTDSRKRFDNWISNTYDVNIKKHVVFCNEE